MINVGFTKEQIILCGYTGEWFAEAESFLCTYVKDIK
jgi:hypothetical protein